jgi:hypothetical protein
MKVKVTKTQLREIIEKHVRQLVMEAEENEKSKDGTSAKNIKSNLRNGINGGDVARYLINNVDEYKDVSEDDLRHRISTWSRGIEPIPPAALSGLKNFMKGFQT